ncbi:MAG: DUF1566 domain-containing protein [Deltaproteobacteria bacterium]|nr:DUF1566 domain-containing protein [Deltaproteobacteria bacterium]
MRIARPLSLVSSLAWLAAACSGKPSATADAKADPNAGDVATTDLATLDLATLELATSDTSKATCPGAQGCACVNDSECDWAACVYDPAAAGGLSCAGPCTNDCKGGFRCVDKPGVEGLQVCVPAAGKACNPCAASDECKSLGSPGQCADRGDSGRFCAVPCVGGGCPDGYACQASTTVEGSKADLCQPTGGECVCSPAAIAKKLATSCAVAAKDASGKVLGSCKGTRTCTATVLPACDAKAWAPETCNGQDDDCDGQTDNGAPCDDSNKCVSGKQCVAGTCTAGTPKTCDDQNDCSVDTCDPKNGNCDFAPQDGKLCNDGDPCTAGETCSKGVCQGGVAKPCPCAADADCKPQEDGNLCNGTLYCDAKKLCALNPATVVVCPDLGAQCSANECKKATGQCEAVNLSDGVTCSDGLPWTVGDVCTAGKCVAGVETKLCKNDGDCGKYEDGDKCNGTLFCNKATGVCQLNPKTVVQCPSAFNTACSKNQCVPLSGQCTATAVADQKPCEDGNLCTTGEACQAGVCQPSASGGNTCACQNDADCGKFEDGNACNGTLFCNLAKGQCQLNPATVVVCQSVNDGPCGVNVCDKVSGKCAMLAALDGVACDADGSPCTPLDACKSGVCVKDTADICQCTTDAQCAKYDDGDLCNGVQYCNKGKNTCAVNPGSVVSCPPAGSACLANVCAPATGKCSAVAANEGAGCDDGDAETAGDVCAEGACKGKAVAPACKADGDCGDDGDGNPCTTLGCIGGACVKTLPGGVTCTDDGNPCTDDKCSSGACQNTANSAACDDGQACTGNDVCAGKVCKGAAKNCDDKNPCTTDLCDAAKGCIAVTNGDACIDSNPCTKDSCDAVKGCSNAAAAGPCSDGNACTLGDSCANGACLPGAVTGCDDGNACTKDACDPAKGCGNTGLADGAACSDSNACTVGDNCQGAVCLAGSATKCDDGNVCTTDSCDAAKGCSNAAAAGPCSDGNACTPGDVCANGACLPGAVTGCDDGNACTKDACDPAKGCGNKGLPDGAACSDSNACTVGDNCQGVVCLAGSATKCDDGNVCTTDSCDAAKGCSNAAAAGPCSDGNACTPGDVCANGACLPGAVTICDDGNACTKDACDAAKGCGNTGLPDGAACSDSNACTVGDNCQGVVCLAGSATKCDDGNVCTTDSCDAGKGCVNAGVTAGTDCGGGKACNGKGSCVVSECGDGVCDGEETVPSCPGDCAYLAARLGGPCNTPGAKDSCADGFFCVARGLAGGGNVCVADFETWLPLGDSHPASDFTEQTDYVVDNKTGLQWAKESVALGNWTYALTACSAETYGGFKDWRLPVLAELFSLADRSTQNPACSAPNLSWPNDTWLYWSSSPWVGGASAWLVYFGNGHSNYNSNGIIGTCRVRCVR